VAASSVTRRLLLSVAVPLLLFFGVAIAVLDERFRAMSQSALRAQLDSQLVALIASSDPDEAGAVAPALQNAESRLATPGSGLYARVVNRRGLQVWRSPSNTGVFIEYGPPLLPGQSTYQVIAGPRDGPVACLSRGLRWEDDRGRRIDLTFSVAMSLEPYTSQLHSFRQQLLGGFTVVGLLLLATMALLLRWVLRPLHDLEAQIRDVENGEREQLDTGWPRELRGVVANLNALLTAERNRIARYRDTLGNLAHSLKTPLAVVRSSLSGKDPTTVAATVNAQVDRMSAIVEHQLKRAVGGGASVGGKAVPVAPVAQDLRAALLKAHASKDFSLELGVDAVAQFAGDRDDLYEALGNLMENAAKWCRNRVRVTATMRDLVDGARRLEVVIEDDGPGIPAAERGRVMQRGERADELVPGHGLGLAMVCDMARTYGGDVLLGDAALGGTKVTLLLPGR
jgi:two-component system sensor histidine kinase PhoQ